MWIDKLATVWCKCRPPSAALCNAFFSTACLFSVDVSTLPILPHAVLTSWQKRLIDRLCSEQRFVSMAYADGLDDAPVIGTVERRLAVGQEQLPPRRQPASEGSRGLAAEVRQRS